jgi:hypothetical protein
MNFLVLIIKKQIIPKWLHLNLCLLFTLLIFSLFMITPQSKILYEHFPYLKYLQFPWRWVSPVIVITSILSGSISFLFIKNLMAGNKAEQKKTSPFFTTVLIFLVVSATLALLNMSDIRKTYVHWPDEYFSPENIRRQNLKATYLAEYRSVWAADEPDTPVIRELECESDDAFFDFNEKTRHSTLRRYEVQLGDKCHLTAQIYYFPGWKVYSNHQLITFEVTQKGLLSFELPKGTHDIKIVFEETYIRKLGNTLSFMGLAAMALTLFFHYLYRNRH